MNPAVTLVLTLLALHVLEGVYWVRRTAAIFRRRGRRYAVEGTAGPLGDAQHTVVLLSPLPPLDEVHVVEELPFVLGPTEGWSVGVDPDPKAAPGGVITPSAAVRARAEGKEVRAGDGLHFMASSPAAARHWAELLKAWGQADPAARAEVMRDALERRHDLEEVRARLQLYRGHTRVLAWVGSLLPFLLVGGLAVWFLVPELAHLGPWALGLGGFLLAYSWIQLYRVHRRLYPQLSGDRAMKLLMVVLSFPAAARVRAWLGRDLLASFDPLAVAGVLLEEEALGLYLSERWRRIQHPRGPFAVAPEPPWSKARAVTVEVQDHLLRRLGRVPGSLLDPPPREGLDAVAYCPRCHSSFRAVEGECSECPGVMRRRFPTH